jgi:UDP-2,3-diacylglucosamine hydrolase
MSEEYLFISDCHLDSGQPEVTAALTRFLRQRAAGAARVYILGDLFEVWLGDDDPAAAAQPVIECLQALSDLGPDFAARTGLTLLSEPHRLQLGGQQVLLVHGDTLCTDDHDYQQFRAMVRNQDWQASFLGQPLAERQRIAAALRNDSVEAMTQKSLEIMDVNPQAVEDCFRQQQVDTIIHGHTHRPAVHRYDHSLVRYVLGDWNPGPSYLSWDSQQGFRLVDPRVV